MSDYEKLKKLYEQIDELIKIKVTPSDPKFKGWYGNCKIFLTNKFGAENVVTQNFISTSFYSPLLTEESIITKCRKGLETTKLMFEPLLEDMESEITETAEPKAFNTESIFIVHGHDAAMKSEVAREIEKQGINAIILHEQPNAGKTIIEKIESYGNTVGAAVILFTPDDDGKAKSEADYKNRARQNVIFEAGYFMGLLGRQRTICIFSDSSIEVPSDLQGIVYTNNNWRFDLMRELRTMGFKIDMNKLL